MVGVELAAVVAGVELVAVAVDVCAFVVVVAGIAAVVVATIRKKESQECSYCRVIQKGKQKTFCLSVTGNALVHEHGVTINYK